VQAVGRLIKLIAHAARLVPRHGEIDRSEVPVCRIGLARCAQLEPIVFPIMKRMISTEGADVMEEVLELVAYFSYYSPSVSPALWSLWPQARRP